MNRKIGFLSSGHWSDTCGSATRSASDVLPPSIDLAVAAEDLGVDGAYFRVHHFARQLASPFPLLAAVGAKTHRIEIGAGVIDMRYEIPSTWWRTLGSVDLISGGRRQLGLSRGSPEQVAEGWRHFGCAPAAGETDADMGRRHAEVFLDFASGAPGAAAPPPPTPSRRRDGTIGGPLASASRDLIWGRSEQRPVMTQAPTHIVKLLHDCERLARLSDRLIKVGPLNLGIDSVLALLPVGGGLYTIGLGGWLLYMGHKAGASRATLVRMGAYVGVDAVTAAVPLLGSMVDMLFPGHILAVRALRADLERRYGPIPGERVSARRGWAGFGGRSRRPFAA